MLPRRQPEGDLLRSETILSLQRLIRDELVMLRRLASDRRVASILLPVLRRSGLAAPRAGSAPKPIVTG